VQGTLVGAMDKGLHPWKAGSDLDAGTTETDIEGARWSEPKLSGRDLCLKHGSEYFSGKRGSKSR